MVPETHIVRGRALNSALNSAALFDAHSNGSVRVHEQAAQAFAQAIALLGEQLARANHQIEALEAQRADASEKGPETDPLPAIGLQTLSQAGAVRQ